MWKARRPGRLKITIRLCATVAVLTFVLVAQGPSSGLRPSAAGTGAAILLSFDDGPDPVWTPRVLKVLTWKHEHAVFCVTGEHAQMWPELIKAIVAEGSTLCVHSWNHPHMLTLSSAQQLWQVKATDNLLVSLAGKAHVKFWRAPYGQSRPRLDAYARSLGLTPLGYNAEGSDWTPGVTPAIVMQLLETQLATVPAAQYQAGAWEPPGTLVAVLHDARGENHTRASVDRWPTTIAVTALSQEYTITEPQGP